jgi:hypothetical protein
VTIAAGSFEEFDRELPGIAARHDWRHAIVIAGALLETAIAGEVAAAQAAFEARANRIAGQRRRRSREWRERRAIRKSLEDLDVALAGDLVLLPSRVDLEDVRILVRAFANAGATARETAERLANLSRADWAAALARDGPDNPARILGGILEARGDRVDPEAVEEAARILEERIPAPNQATGTVEHGPPAVQAARQ